MSDVLIGVEHVLGRITLNRPKALNALTLDMVREIDRALIAWEENPEVRFVLIDGAGERGLCAGGDIRWLYDSARSKTGEATTFFREEYRLNARIAEYKKPIIALMHGIVMGGGIGISAHASHRVVTEKSGLTMPEVGIGFFPDIGATYLLGAKAPGEVGTHIALSTPKLSGQDAIEAGLAEYFIPADRFGEIPALLRDCASRDDVTNRLSGLSNGAPEGSLVGARSWIDDCYIGDDVELMLARLDARPEAAAQAAANDIRSKSPMALKQTLRALRRARKLAVLRPCLEWELVIADQFMALPDFLEGVRAAVIDKDRNPSWSPARLGDVTPELLEQYFPETPSSLPALFDSERR